MEGGYDLVREEGRDLRAAAAVFMVGGGRPVAQRAPPPPPPQAIRPAGGGFSCHKALDGQIVDSESIWLAGAGPSACYGRCYGTDGSAAAASHIQMAPLPPPPPGLRALGRGGLLL